jgi:hypothetical protein
MPLIRCPDCRQFISDRASRCTECGRPIADERKARRQFAVQAVILLMIGGGVIWVYLSGVLETLPTPPAAPEAEGAPRVRIQRTVPPDPARLSAGLARVPGEFTHTDDGWHLSDPEHTLFHRLSLAADSAVVALVGCLDRADPATATVAGAPAAVGVMCYEALRFVADPFPPDGTAGWPGQLEPTASPQRLQAAQRAWRDLMVTDRYRLRHAPVTLPQM